MAFYEAPSFSLGLDLDFDLGPQIPVPDCTNQKPASDLSVGVKSSSKEGDGGEAGAEFSDCVLDIRNDPPRKLKRLKRGQRQGTVMAKQKESIPSFHVVDDDIEEFSSQEDFPRDSYPSSHLRPGCSSSKAPLHGILTAPTSIKLKAEKRKQVFDAQTSVCSEKQNKSIFSNLTISPLRRFQLLESDSDDPSGCDNQTRRRHGTSSSLNEKNISGHSAPAREEKKRSTPSVTQKEDLWKDLCQTKSFPLPTPAFDEVCEEFFQLQKENKEATEIGSNTHLSFKDHRTNNIDANKVCDKFNFPAHYYFYNDDPRIQALVRNRLPNFFPLGVDSSRGSVIDYMRQFNSGEASTSQAPIDIEKNSNKLTGKSNRSKKAAPRGRVNRNVASPLSGKRATKLTASQKNKIDKSSRNVKNKLGQSNSEELLKDSDIWIDPKSSSSLPRDAGKRRIHASGQSTGHWYTSPEGKKVYISKSGEELSGRSAYRCYKKDTGGFRKSKKKGSGKKRKR